MTQQVDNPYADLASPVEGSAASLAAVNSRQYIDVEYLPSTGAKIKTDSIDGGIAPFQCKTDRRLISNIRISRPNVSVLRCAVGERHRVGMTGRHANCDPRRGQLAHD